jgi:hypothetical protein
MNQVVDTHVQPVPASTSADSRTTRHLFTLLFALLFGGIVVWQLRQEWAKETWLPWPFLLAVMFVAAQALRGLELWLPGEAILPELAPFSTPQRQLIGSNCITAALLLTGWITWRLQPDYRQWHGTPSLWLLALILVFVGAWLIGAVGRGSPRAATALRMWSDSPRNRWLEALAFTGILALAIFLRTYHFNTIPPGIYVDETNGGLDSLYILEGRDVSPFATGWYGTPNSFLYYMAGIFKIFGANWLGLKLVSLIAAILTVPAIYLLGRLMFGPLVGLSAMTLMAVSRWHLSLSRWGWNETAPPLFQVLATFFLIRGLRDRRALDYALSGLLMGLSIYTYLSARLAVATLFLYILYWLLSDPSGLRPALRRSWLGLTILTLAAIVAVAPIGVTYITDRFAFNNRVAEISVFRDIREQGSLAPLTQNIGDILKFFHQTGDLQGKHNLPGEPMADPITGLLFAIGVAYAILGWRDQRRVLLLLWLVLGLAGSFLSSHHESPQSYRALTALPAVVLMAADILDRVARALYRFLHDQPSTAQYSSFAMTGIVVLALAGSTIWESSVYFGRQATSIDVLRGFNPTENGVAHETIAALQRGEEVYLSPRFSEYSPLRFLVYGVMKAKTGKNTLDDRPYQVVLPEVNLPLPDHGHDILILLDADYWSLRDYIASLYPQAQMELVRLPDDSPIYMRIKLSKEQVAERQGLIEHLTYADGRTEEKTVPQVEIKDARIREASWEGVIRLAHGGQYQLQGENGLQVFLEDQPMQGKHYLGRGLYHLRLTWKSGTGNPTLTWRMNDGDSGPVPAEVLFHINGPRQGLLGTYWNNMNWEGEPLFHQVTPFLLLAWPDEQPIVPNGQFSARYTGLLHVTEPGTYLLRVEADDGARLTLDNNVLGEGLTAGQPNSFEANVDLEPGDHTIKIDYFQQGGGSGLRLYWSRNGAPATPVPPTVLIPRQP